MASRVLGLMRSTSQTRHGACGVCGRSIAEDEERMRLPTGGYIHRGCSTYRMRQRRLMARRLR